MLERGLDQHQIIWLVEIVNKVYLILKKAIIENAVTYSILHLLCLDFTSIFS